MKKNITLYSNGSCKNHGCEAIAFSTVSLLKNLYEHLYISTTNKNDDFELSKLENVSLHEYSYAVKRNALNRIIAKLEKRDFQKPWISNVKKAFKKSEIALSIGGDNYCYKNSNWLYILNKEAKKNKLFTVLWGCSIEPNRIDESMLYDLKKFDLIIARESITYYTLLEKQANKNIKLYPDPAFTLEKIELPLPEGFIKDNTIGINLSPLVMEYEAKEGKTFLNFKNLLHYIIEETDMQIALIPHVVLKSNNDLDALSALYEMFKNTGRVILINNHNCKELKGFISRCRMFIGARTHATIAAYSSCVPTLTLGYSVKATGIARDIFNSEKDLVVRVQNLENELDLVNAYKIFSSREEEIRTHLKLFMPKYIQKAFEVTKEIV